MGTSVVSSVSRLASHYFGFYQFLALTPLCFSPLLFTSSSDSSMLLSLWAHVHKPNSVCNNLIVFRRFSQSHCVRLFLCVCMCVDHVSFTVESIHSIPATQPPKALFGLCAETYFTPLVTTTTNRTNTLIIVFIISSLVLYLISSMLTTRLTHTSTIDAQEVETI